MGQIKEEDRGCHISSPPPTCQGARYDSKRLQLTQIQWWNCNSNNHRRDQDIQVQERQWPEPRVAQVRHAANATCLTHQENAQHGARSATNVEIKTILVHVVGQSKRAHGIARDNPMAGTL